MAQRDVAKEYREAGKKAQAEKQSKYQHLKDVSSKGGLTWDQADAEALLAAVAAVTEDGAAVLLSKTSDGGALVVRVVDDTASTPFYPASTSALYDVLCTLVTTAKEA